MLLYIALAAIALIRTGAHARAHASISVNTWERRTYAPMGVTAAAAAEVLARKEADQAAAASTGSSPAGRQIALVRRAAVAVAAPRRAASPVKIRCAIDGRTGTGAAEQQGCVETASVSAMAG